MTDSPAHSLLDDVLALPVPPAGDARVQELRKYVPRAYAAWTPEEERCLLELLQAGREVGDVSLLLLRQPGGITARMRRLNLEIPDDMRGAVHEPETFIPTVLTRLFEAEVPQGSPPGSQGLTAWVQQRRKRAGQFWSATEMHCLGALARRGWTAPRLATLLQRGLLDVQRQLQLEGAPAPLPLLLGSDPAWRIEAHDG